MNLESNLLTSLLLNSCCCWIRRTNLCVVRLKEVTAELEAKEAAEANAKAEETDSDDDVQIIASSFDAEVAAKNQR